MAKASNELSEDAPIGAQIESAMRIGAPWVLDYHFLRGSGAGQPRGILNDPALIAVTKGDAQEADSLYYENFVSMFSRLHPQCVGNSIWIATPTAIPQLSQLSINLGLSGEHIPVMTNSNGQFTILTRPVLFSEKMPVLGDQGDVLLVDPTQYGVAIRRELEIERSGHVYFTSDESAWRGIVRVDGMGLWGSVYTPRHGDTLSWCVVTEART
jgi:HK97 family phage major capsid protein